MKVDTTFLSAAIRVNGLSNTNCWLGSYARKMGISQYAAVIAFGEWLKSRPDLDKANINRLQEIFYLSDVLGMEYTDFLKLK